MNTLESTERIATQESLELNSEMPGRESAKQ